MNRNYFAVAFAVFVAVAARQAEGQAVATASQQYQLSAFAGASGVLTGIYSGRNLSITAGANLGIGRYFGFYPSVTVRGTFPVDKGNVDSQQNVLGGVQVEKHFGRFHPYVDFLIGRGLIKYDPPLLNASGTLYYIQNPSTVFSPGGGVDFDLTDHLAVKADAQYQRYSTPVVSSGHVFSTPITVGVTYRFDFNHHKHAARY